MDLPAAKAAAGGSDDAGADLAPDVGEPDIGVQDVGPLPDGSPTLVPGVWVDISPRPGNIVPAAAPGTEPTYNGEPQNGTFGQGLAFDPSAPSTLYVCLNHFDSTHVGLYRSTNAGTSWTRIGNFDEPVRVRVDPKNGQHIYVGDGVRGSTQGFWVSSDGGNTWAQPDAWVNLPAANNNFFVDDVYDVAVDKRDFNHVLVSFHSPWGTARPDYWNNSSGVLETTDGGNTWIVHNPPPNNWGSGHDIAFLGNSSTWLLGTQGAGYWRTSDSGASWTQVSMNNMAHGGGQLYKAATGVIYASFAGGVMRSMDDGVSWTTVGSSQLTFATSVYGDGNLMYTHHAYSGGGSAPWYTSAESDGTTWTAFGGGMFTDGPFEMAFDSAHGILYSSNWGNGVLALQVFSKVVSSEPSMGSEASVDSGRD